MFPSRLAWLKATSAGQAVGVARVYAKQLREFARAQREGATLWTAYGEGADDFCLEMASLCNRTASNAERHAAAYNVWASTVESQYLYNDRADIARREVKIVLED